MTIIIKYQIFKEKDSIYLYNRYLSFGLLFYLLLSCNNKKEQITASNENFNISMDTVIIQAEDELLDLRRNLMLSDLSKKNNFLYNFNMYDNSLEKIDLNKLKLTKKIPLEIEGPNGTGRDIGRIQITETNQLLLSGMNHSYIFDLKGNKVRNIIMEDFSLGGHPLEEREQLKVDRAFHEKTNRLFGLLFNYGDLSYKLGMLDLNKFSTKKYPLKNFKKVSEFEIILSVGKSRIFYSPKVYLEKFTDKVILSNEITSTLTWYGIETERLEYKSYNSKITENKKIQKYTKTHTSVEQFEKEKRRIKQEITFLPPFWCEEYQRFYRFSYLEKDQSTKGSLEIESEIYLTCYDKDLKRLWEASLPQLTKTPGRHFAKDGKIWIFENIRDEMGFVRIDIQKINS